MIDETDPLMLVEPTKKLLLEVLPKKQLMKAMDRDIKQTARDVVIFSQAVGFLMFRVNPSKAPSSRGRIQMDPYPDYNGYAMYPDYPDPDYTQTTQTQYPDYTEPYGSEPIWIDLLSVPKRDHF